MAVRHAMAVKQRCDVCFLVARDGTALQVIAVTHAEEPVEASL